MSHKLFLNTGAKTFDVTPIIGDISWTSSTDTLGQSLSFKVAYSDTSLFPKNPSDLGHLVILMNGTKEIYRGINVTENKSGRNPIEYVSFDYAFYLNKSSRPYQFSKLNAKQAITRIANDFGVPVGNIVSMPTLIKKIYMTETGAEVIEDIIAQVEKDVGYKLRMEMRVGKLYIEKRNDLVISGTFQLAGINYNIADAISDPTRSRSIEEMKNSVRIILQGEKDSYTTKATAKDESLIDKYGLLELTETIEKTDVAKAKNIAKNRLKEFGRVFEDNSIRLIGHDDVRAGRILKVEEPITGMSGQYLIKSVTHNLTGAQHFMDVSLGVVV